MELVDIQDLKSWVRKGVPVRVRQGAPELFGNMTMQHKDRAPRYFWIARNTFLGLIWFVVGYFLLISLAATHATWLNIWLRLTDPLVQFERELFPVFSKIQLGLAGEGFTDRIAIAHHAFAAIWLVNVMMIAVLIVMLAGLAFDSTMKPKLPPPIDTSSRLSAYKYFVAWILFAVGGMAVYAFGWTLPSNAQLSLQNNFSLFALGALSWTLPLALAATVLSAITIFRKERIGWNGAAQPNR